MWYFYERSPLIIHGYYFSILQSYSVKISAKFIYWYTSYSVWKQPTSEFFAKMEKSKFRVLIKHNFLRRKTLSETKAKLDKYYSDSSSSYEMVQKWFTEFCCGCTDTGTIPSPARPNDTTRKWKCVR